MGHLLKVKAKLEQTLDELEDSLEREKKTRAEMDKAKRKVEGDLKLTQEAVADLEKNKRELEQTMMRKDREIAQLSSERRQGLAEGDGRGAGWGRGCCIGTGVETQEIPRLESTSDFIMSQRPPGGGGCQVRPDRVTMGVLGNGES